MAISRLTVLRQYLQRFAFIVLVAASFLAMLLGKADTIMIEKLRIAVIDASGPVMELLSHPSAEIARTVENIRELGQIRAENDRLREENSRLLRWQSVARQMEKENEVLRSLLNFTPSNEAAFITARVIADSGGAFARSVLVNVGANNNIRKGLAVVTGEGLAGRVADVGQRSSRVLLLTDLNSKIPVLLENSRTRAIMAGDNTTSPRLLYISGNQKVTVGERLVTSSHGGVFPPGIPVGVVSSVSESIIRITPFVDINRLEFLRVIDYGLSGVILKSNESKSSDAELLK